jgi:hypothetical protein
MSFRSDFSLANNETFFQQLNENSPDMHVPLPFLFTRATFTFLQLEKASQYRSKELTFTLKEHAGGNRNDELHARTW